MNKSIRLYLGLLVLPFSYSKAQNTGDSILTKLLEGNKRFMIQKSVHHNDDKITILKTSAV